MCNNDHLLQGCTSSLVATTSALQNFPSCYDGLENKRQKCAYEIVAGPYGPPHSIWASSRHRSRSERVQSKYYLSHCSRFNIVKPP